MSKAFTKIAAAIISASVTFGFGAPAADDDATLPIATEAPVEASVEVEPGLTQPEAEGLVENTRADTEFPAISEASVYTPYTPYAEPSDPALVKCMFDNGIELPITPQSANWYYTLACPNYPIRDLSGIESLTRLNILDLSGTLVSDLSPIASFTDLRNLNLDDSPVSDLTPLTNLKSLMLLSLRNTEVTAASLKNLKNLTNLIDPPQLYGTGITDFSALEPRFGPLLKSTDAALISCLDTGYQWYPGASIVRDGWPLPMSKVTSISRLNCANYPIRDISALKNFTNLEFLDVSNSKITDLSPLANTRINSLYISGTPVSDLRPISKKYLRDLDISLTRVTDLTPLKEMDTLNYLTLDNTNISDLRPLTGLTWLYYISANSTPISDISPLAALRSLQHIKLGDTQVKNVSPIRGLDKVIRLYLGGSKVTDQDMTDLTGLNSSTATSLFYSLRDLDLRNTAVSESYVQQLKSLKYQLRNSIPLSISSGRTQFADVAIHYQFADDIDWLIARGITNGYEDGTFKPNSPVSRQAMAAFLHRAARQPGFALPSSASFTDVPRTHTFHKEIEWLNSTGIATGYDNGSFKPGADVSREAMAAFLYRAAGSPKFKPPVNPTFNDVPKSNRFYLEIEWLVSTHITSGYDDGGFHPSAKVTRAAMAAFLHRAIEGNYLTDMFN